MRVFIFSLLGILAVPFAFGATSFTQKTSYNSEFQFGSQLGGSYGLGERATLNLGFAYSRTPYKSLAKVDTYYQGTAGLSYGITTMAVDFGGLYAYSPIAKLRTVGGYAGFTYLYYRDPDDEGVDPKRAFSTLHRQRYENDTQINPVFWTRIGYNGGSLRSSAAGDGIRTGGEYSVTLDFYVPATPSLLGGFGGGLYGYEDRGNLFQSASETPTTINAAFLGSTVQGLPAQAYWGQLFWQLARYDTFTPRYQGTVLLSSSKWVHTAFIGWKHEFPFGLAVTPGLEFSNVSARTTSGASLQIDYFM